MQVKSLVPTLQILDGHPLVPGKVKRRYEGKRVFSRGEGEQSVVEEKETQAKKAKKKISGEKPKLEDEDDAPEKPFVELITKAQPAEVKKVTDVRQESGVVAVIDANKKQTGGIWRRKQGIAALAAFKEPEIGTGGPSSWDAPVEAPAAVAPVAPTTTYSRWALKKK